jgi:hypothetical protein
VIVDVVPVVLRDPYPTIQESILEGVPETHRFGFVILNGTQGPIVIEDRPNLPFDRIVFA